MSLSDKNKKKQFKSSGFTILSGDATDGHGGYGVGSINLDNVTPVFIDPEEERAFIDMGALHARSEVEKRVRFHPDKSKVPNGKLYWLVWVTVDHKEGKPYYAGVGACEMLIEREEKRIRNGYKSMPEHVNNMDKSLKGRIVVDHMDDFSKKMLREFLKGFNEEMWKNASPELHEALKVEEE